MLTVKIISENMEKKNKQTLVIEQVDVMPELHSTKDLINIATQYFNEKCDALERIYGYR